MRHLAPPRNRLALAHTALAAACLFGRPAHASAQPGDAKTQPAPVTISQGKSGPQRPEAATRTVRLFDFEEMTTNPTLLPRFWLRAKAPSVDSPDPPGSRTAHSRAGFPAWNEAELDYSAP